jgi:hypothetical protein
MEQAFSYFKFLTGEREDNSLFVKLGGFQY